MNYYTKKDLMSNLNGLVNYLELNSHNTGSVIISEYGGRALGIFPKKESYSLLWINPELRKIIKNNSSEIGGDRYWLSPERKFFYKNPEDWEEWFCPAGLDPADYKIRKNSSTDCTLSTRLYITNQFNKETYGGDIIRKIQLVEEPIQTDVDYCGIQYIDICTLNKSDLQINGWSLATVISGGTKNPGTVIIPTKNNPKPLSYFRKIPEERLFIGKNYVGFKIDVEEIYKLAIRPEDIDFSKKAKIGYVLKIPHQEEYGFIVKLSDDLPQTQEDCFDVARDHPESEIGIIQSYNSESQQKEELQFGEIELQLKKFYTINKKSKSKATHQLFGYIGSKEEIFEVVDKYMGITNPKLF
jgi:hypothetical protein